MNAAHTTEPHFLLKLAQCSGVPGQACAYDTALCVGAAQRLGGCEPRVTKQGKISPRAPEYLGARKQNAPPELGSSALVSRAAPSNRTCAEARSATVAHVWCCTASVPRTLREGRSPLLAVSTGALKMPLP